MSRPLNQFLARKTRSDLCSPGPCPWLSLTLHCCNLRQRTNRPRLAVAVCVPSSSIDGARNAQTRASSDEQSIPSGHIYHAYGLLALALGARPSPPGTGSRLAFRAVYPYFHIRYSVIRHRSGLWRSLARFARSTVLLIPLLANSADHPRFGARPMLNPSPRAPTQRNRGGKATR